MSIDSALPSPVSVLLEACRRWCLLAFSSICRADLDNVHPKVV